MPSTRRTRASNDSSPSTRCRARWAMARVPVRSASAASIAARQPIDLADRHDAAVDAVVHELGRAAGGGGDDRRFDRHRLEHGVGRALVVGRLHEQIEGVMRADHVGDVAEQRHAVVEAEPVALKLERGLAGCRRRR